MRCVWEVAALPRTLAVCSQAEHTSPPWDVDTYVSGRLLCVSGRCNRVDVCAALCHVDTTGWMLTMTLLCVSGGCNRVDADTAVCVR